MQTGRPSRPVGILGGMGPAAGADFSVLFVTACAEHMRATGSRCATRPIPSTGWRRCRCRTAAARSNRRARAPTSRSSRCCRRWAGWPRSGWARWRSPATPRMHGMRHCSRLSADRVLHVAEVAADLAARRARRGTDGDRRHLPRAAVRAALQARDIACVTRPRRSAQADARHLRRREGRRHALAEDCFSQVAAAWPAGTARLPDHGLHGDSARTAAAKLRPGLDLLDPARVLAKKLAACAYGREEPSPLSRMS